MKRWIKNSLDVVNVALVFCVFGIFVCRGVLGYFYFMSSVPVQLIVWEDRPRNDLLCV